MSSFFRNNRRLFPWKCFVRKQLLLDLPYLETSIQSTAVYFRAHTHKSMIHHLLPCHRRVSKHRDRSISFTQSTRIFFWAIDKLCRIQREQIFLIVKFSWMCVSSHCRGEKWSVSGGWFFWFLRRQLANKCSSGTISTVFPKKQAIICLEVLRTPATTADCCLLSASYAQNHDSTPITMWTQREQIFLTVKCSWNIECIMVQLMPKVVSISR